MKNILEKTVFFMTDKKTETEKMNDYFNNNLYQITF